MKFFSILALCAAFLATSLAPARAADPVDPEALKLAHQILEATHATALGDQMMSQMIKAFGTGLNQANPGRGKEVEDLLEQVFVPEFRKSMPQLLDESANIYALNFSVDELKQILAFYQSDIGKKLVDRLPTILREQNQISQVFMRNMLPGIQNKMIEALKAKGLKQPDRT